MNSIPRRSVLFLNGLRWFARFWGLTFAGSILALGIGEGFNPAKLNHKEFLLAILFGIAWVGLLLGWKWEGLGGVLVVAGVGSFCLVHFAVTGYGRFPGWAFPAIAVPGLLYLLSWFCRRKTRASTSMR